MLCRATGGHAQHLAQTHAKAPPLRASGCNYTWDTKLAAMPTVRYELAVAVVGTTVYAVCGGYGNGLTTLESFDTRAGTWTTAPPIAAFLP